MADTIDIKDNSQQEIADSSMYISGLILPLVKCAL